MLIGYGRVSTQDQNLQLQIDALRVAGCEQIFQEAASGAKRSRPKWDECLNTLRKGDTLVVWKIDRIGRSLINLVQIIDELKEKDVDFKSIQDPIDTTTSSGMLFFHIIAAMAEYERTVIRERTMAGLQAARARGRVGGRKKGLSKEAMKTAMSAKVLYETQKFSANEICTQLSISRTSMYKYLKIMKVKTAGNNIK